MAFTAVLMLTGFQAGQVYANQSSQTITGNVVIVQPTSITVNPTVAPGGITATVTGSNFIPHKIISIVFTDAQNHLFTVGQALPGVTGTFAIHITIPDAAYPGSATISAQQNSLVIASTKFTIPFPTITLNPISGTGRTQVTITGSGFAINDQVKLFIGHNISKDLIPLGTVSTHSNGAFVTYVTIPSDISVGDYFISARETVNHSVYAASSFSVLPAVTTTTISSLHNPSIFGQSVTFTAKISPVASDDKDHNAGTPTGTVVFTIDGVSQHSVALSSGKAVLSLSSLSIGSHTITARYLGDNSFASSSSTLTQTVNQASSKTTLTSSANPSKFGNKVTFTAAILPIPSDSGTPTGSVTFTIDGHAQSPVILSGSKATLTYSSLSIGSHTISAIYSGDTNFGTSSSLLVQSITK